MSLSAPSVRLGVIGLGQWGPNHVRAFRAIDGCEVIRACDTSEAKQILARRQFRGLEVTSDASSIVLAADIDAVVIATPVESHFTLVKAALEAGKDVLCEKPLASTVAECRILCDLARSRQRILMVGHVFLYNSSVLHLKLALDRRELGRIYYVDAIRTNLGPVRHDVGALHDLASHDISIFNFLLGGSPLKVSATAASFLRQGVEDIGFLTLLYPNEVLCHVHTSWLNPRKVRSVTLVGDSKMAVWDDMNNLEPIRYYDKGVQADNYASFGEFQMILRDGTITIPKLKLHEPLLKQDEEFIRCIRERSEPLASGEFGLSVVQVLAAARASLANEGRLTEIPAA